MIPQLPPELWSMILKFKVDHYVCELKEYCKSKYDWDPNRSRISLFQYGSSDPDDYDYMPIITNYHPTERNWNNFLDRAIDAINWKFDTEEIIDHFIRINPEENVLVRMYYDYYTDYELWRRAEYDYISDPGENSE